MKRTKEEGRREEDGSGEERQRRGRGQSEEGKLKTSHSVSILVPTPPAKAALGLNDGLLNAVFRNAAVSELPFQFVNLEHCVMEVLLHFVVGLCQLGFFFPCFVTGALFCLSISLILLFLMRERL